MPGHGQEIRPQKIPDGIIRRSILSNSLIYHHLQTRELYRDVPGFTENPYSSNPNPVQKYARGRKPRAHNQS